LSCRVQVTYNLSVQNGYPRSKQAVKRDKAKKKRIDCLQQISSSPQHALCKSFFLSSRPIFYSGTLDTTAILPHNIGNPIVEKNPQMPPCSTSGGITGRKKSANAALLLWRHYW
jgi:hypothetical protein